MILIRQKPRQRTKTTNNKPGCLQLLATTSTTITTIEQQRIQQQEESVISSAPRQVQIQANQVTGESKTTTTTMTTMTTNPLLVDNNDAVNKTPIAITTGIEQQQIQQDQEPVISPTPRHVQIQANQVTGGGNIITTTTTATTTNPSIDNNTNASNKRHKPNKSASCSKKNEQPKFRNKDAMKLNPDHVQEMIESSIGHYYLSDDNRSMIPYCLPFDHMFIVCLCSTLLTLSRI